MLLKTNILVVGLLLCGAVAHGKENRWSNFAEDADLKYYLDQKSIITTPEKTTAFWVKSVAKNKEYFKSEYNLNDLAYILTSYEFDCARGMYRVRAMVMYDKNRRELHKTFPLAAEMPGFEPVTPESVLELARDSVCGEAAELPEVATPSPVPTPAPAPESAPELGLQ
jgi:hypothetical protein